MIESHNKRTLWVAANGSDDADGTSRHPFGSVTAAAQNAQPGQNIVVRAGTYAGDQTIQNGGAFDKPLRIAAENGGIVTFVGCCWYFYDVSDIIVSGLAFENAPGMAVSVVGRCRRNRFENIRFVNCGVGRADSCTLFFGGSGNGSTVVESCVFERTPVAGERSVGVMIAEGNLDDGEPNRDIIVNRNSFKGYGYAALVGSSDRQAGEFGHRVTYNVVDGCDIAGIMAKCGDTEVRGNVVKNCAQNAISIAAGSGSVVEDNRIVDCGRGIVVAGEGHSIANNCLIRCASGAIHIGKKSGISTTNAVIEHNTVIGGGNGDGSTGVTIDAAASCVVSGNVFHDMSMPYAFPDDEHRDVKRHCIVGNISSGLCAASEGCVRSVLMFAEPSRNDFSIEAAVGAHGWMCAPEPYVPPDESARTCACGKHEHDAECAPIDQDSVEELVEEVDERDRFIKAMFVDDENCRSAD